MKIDELLCFSVYAANHAISRLYRPHLNRMGLTYPQYLVLVALWERDKRQVTDLGRTLQLDTNTLTPLLKRMEGAGLISRERNPEDERSRIVALTEKGNALRVQAREISSCLSEALGEDLAEIVALRDRLTQIRDRIEKL